MNRLREIRSFRESQSLQEGESKRKMEEPRWIDEKKVSEIIGVAVQTLRNWRFQRVGIPYSKVGKGRMVRYRLDEVIHFMEERKIQCGN